MKTNVGTLDRIARVVLGLVLIALTLTGTIGVWGWIGVVLSGCSIWDWKSSLTRAISCRGSAA